MPSLPSQPLPPEPSEDAADLSGQLEAHIQAARVEGFSVEPGQFTVDPKVALRKLGGSQLGQNGSWILKVVQAVVASQSEQPIQVQQGRSDTRVTFHPGRSWSINEVQAALQRLEIEADEDLVHLRYGLLSAIHFEDLDVQLGFPEVGLCLFWDQDQWRQRPCISAGASVLRVAPKHDTLGQALSWAANRVRNSASSIELSRMLSLHCHTCPLPLTVDGRRIDALQNVSKHQIEFDTFALDLCVLKAQGLPDLRVPPFSYSPKVHKRTSQNQLRGRFPPLTPENAEGVSTAYRLLYHAKRPPGTSPSNRSLRPSRVPRRSIGSKTE